MSQIFTLYKSCLGFTIDASNHNLSFQKHSIITTSNHHLHIKLSTSKQYLVINNVILKILWWIIKTSEPNKSLSQPHLVWFQTRQENKQTHQKSLSGDFELTAPPPYFAEGEKNLEVFLYKKPFFFL